MKPATISMLLSLATGFFALVPAHQLCSSDGSDRSCITKDTITYTALPSSTKLGEHVSNSDPNLLETSTTHGTYTGTEAVTIPWVRPTGSYGCMMNGNHWTCVGPHPSLNVTKPTTSSLTTTAGTRSVTDSHAQSHTSAGTSTLKTKTLSTGTPGCETNAGGCTNTSKTTTVSSVTLSISTRQTVSSTSTSTVTATPTGSGSEPAGVAFSGPLCAMVAALAVAMNMMQL